MGKGLSGHFSKKTYNWPEVHENVLNITHHQGTSKSKPQDITSHMLECLLSKRQEITSVGKDVEKGNPGILLVEM